MKKSLLIFLLFSASNILSQSGWQVVYPGNSYYTPLFDDLKFFNAQTGWVLNFNNVSKTTDGALSWQKYFIVHPGSRLNCFYFFSADVGWVAENNYINFTSNSGADWIVISGAAANPRGIYFRNLLTGYVCGDSGMVKKTTNGGYNWTGLNSGTGVNLRSIIFADENFGICAGDWGTILTTTNGGSAWNLFYDSYLNFFTHVNYLNNQTGFASGTGGSIYRTTNRGLNWSISQTFAYIISSIRFLSSGTGYAFGSPGYLYKTTNSGSTWEQIQANGINSRVFASSIPDNNNIWLSADSSIIYHSSNSGSSWYVKYREYILRENLNSVYFSDQNTGYACGNKGTVIKSTNAGLNWNVSGLGNEYTFTDIQFTDGITGYITGKHIDPFGVIFKTTNSGTDWQLVYLDTSMLSSVHFINPVTGWAAGSGGYYLKTTNSGNNWVRSRFQTSDISDIWFIDDNTGFIGKNGFYKTTSGGAVWEQIAANNITSIQFTGNSGFACSNTSSAYYLLRTTNSGINWLQNIMPGGTSTKIYFVNSLTGWVITGTTVRKTTNSGLNWFIQVSGSNSIPAKNLFFTDSEHGWCVGEYGGIMRTTNGGIGITQISSEIPVKHYLYQNFPNPFNPVTKIRFSIPLLRGVAGEAGRGVLLKIYDVLGKEIAVLVNEKLNLGTYEVNWDASRYSSGVYFYSLITTEFTQTKKMVVIK